MYGTGYPPRHDPCPGQGPHRPLPHEGLPTPRASSPKDRPHCPLGKGSTFFNEAVQAIKDIDYEGWIISETFYNRRNFNENGMDYVSSARQDVDTLKAAFSDY